MSRWIRENQKYLQWAMYITAAVLLFAWLQPLVAERSAVTVIERTIRGLQLGGIYTIIALGIVVINKSSGVFNFAHGGMMMISSYLFFAFFSAQNISLVLAIILASVTVFMTVTTASWEMLKQPQVLGGSVATIAVLSFLMSFQPEGSITLLGVVEIQSFGWINALTGAITGTILMGLLIERFTIRPLIGQPIFAAVMVTLALAEILSGVTTLIWGPNPKPLTIFGEQSPFLPGTYTRIRNPIEIDTTAWLGEAIQIDQPRLYAFFIVLIAFAAFFLLFRFTNIGLAMRATSENQSLAESVGLRVRVILAVTWGVAALLAGVAGIMHVGASDTNSLSTDLQFIALRAFPAVLLGGLESITGALVGGLILGLTEEWAKMLFGGEIAIELAPYVVLMIVLVLRPEGLFGEKRIERI